MFTQQQLLTRVMMLIPMVLSLSVHEWAHAFSAKLLGDDTAERQGRLTLNPVAHIDPIGTLLLPLLGVPFGWAKPVPINPTRFRRDVNMRTGMAVSAAAGPASNFVLALLCTVGLGLWYRAHPEAMLDRSDVASLLLEYSALLNVTLGLFNLLPVPPLDGSRVAARFLGDRFPRAWATVERYAVFLLLPLFLGAGYLLAAPRAYAMAAIHRAAFAIAGL